MIKIRKKIFSEHACYYSVKKTVIICTFQNTEDYDIHNTIILPAVFYGCEM